MSFDELLAKCASTAYPEPESPLHADITPKAVSILSDRLSPGATILDIGCGNGLALGLFKSKGFHPTGISVLQCEVDAAREKGFPAAQLDMHRVSELLGRYDGVFARHVLEHSPCPMFVLHQIHHVMTPGGWLYVEVPMPETAAHHEQNPNHHTVLTRLSWGHLISRSGFKIDNGGQISFQLKLGPDEYAFYLAQKQ